MRCGKCGLGRNNGIHTNKSRRGNHEYLAPEEPPYVETVEERLDRLERRIEVLEGIIP